MGEARSRLQREIRQNRPFRTKGQEALLGVLKTADVLRRRVGAVLEPSGLTAQQYNVLRILRGAGEVGLPTLAIRDRMIEQAPGVTRLLDRLESKGWIERERGGGDRRQVWCRITVAGIETLSRLDEPMARADGGIAAALQPADLDRLIDLLDQVRAAHEPARTSVRDIETK